MTKARYFAIKFLESSKTDRPKSQLISTVLVLFLLILSNREKVAFFYR